MEELFNHFFLSLTSYIETVIQDYQMTAVEKQSFIYTFVI